MGFLARIDDTLRTKESIFAEGAESGRRGGKKWGNEDLDPSPPQHRTWGSWNYFAFFWAVSFNPVAWNAGSSLVALGLLWWEALLAAAIACMFCGTCLVLNSRGPSVYHVGFPVYLRIGAGLYGSLWFVFIRGIVAVFFFGTQSYYAAQMVNVMLRCIFSTSWTHRPNHLPQSAGVTSNILGCFFIFWFAQLGFMFIHPRNSRILYTVKSIACPPVLLATFAFIVAKSGGLGQTHALTTTTVSAATIGWNFMGGISSVAGGLMTEVSSNPDLARYAKKSRATTWPQWFGLVIAKTLCTFLGIGASSAVKTLWGTAYWNIWDLYSAILDHYFSGGARCAIFLACVVQAFAVVATNLASNSLPVGSDLTGLFPRYFNIRRGQIACAILSIATCPWILVNNAASFLTFLNANVCFLSPLVSIMITDYFLIRKGNVHVPSLYSPHSTSPYWYKGGFNIRAFVAWTVAVVSVIHGLAGSFNSHYNLTSTHIYKMGMLLTFAIAGPVYYAICWFWPPMIYPQEHENAPKTFEYMGKTDGYFDSDIITGVVAEENNSLETDHQQTMFDEKV
ncbi:permease [Coleophoma crateriformis]|uniref:Permease n=1 Tax=Coleophoma crateriformis TaxID=565419 RepID=A0A3D8S3X8_9HELO|nr:permease [Coleophoma crateriformis]